MEFFHLVSKQFVGVRKDYATSSREGNLFSTLRKKNSVALVLNQNFHFDFNLCSNTYTTAKPDFLIKNKRANVCAAAD